MEDGATVHIYYESRLAKVNLDEEGRRLIEEFDAELEETDELSEAQKAKAKWAKLEAIVGQDELAFYDVLGVNDSAVKVLGDDTLREIARELADKVRRNATIDWTVKESVRARLMVLVRRTLNKYGYPPDKQQQAVEIVMKQAEIIYEIKPSFGLAMVADKNNTLKNIG